LGRIAAKIPAMNILSRMMMPLIRRLDPEDAHQLALNALQLGLGGVSDPARDDPALSIRAMGLRFPNPIGIGAGFDRLNEDRAIIIRMGFNNQGIDRFAVRMARLHRVSASGRHVGAKVPVGANLGINKTGADPERDYPLLVGRIKNYVDYIVINLSSPNTPGLRDLLESARLKSILDAIAAAHPERPPLLVKLSPDMARDDIPDVVEAAIAGGAQGLIVTNTTISRPRSLRSADANETGGLSGRPLTPLACDTLAHVARAANRRLTLVACGGIESGADIVERVRMGADLVQLYTAYAYEGPAIVSRLKRETLTALRLQGFETLSDAKGTALS